MTTKTNHNHYHNLNTNLKKLPKNNITLNFTQTPNKTATKAPASLATRHKKRRCQFSGGARGGANVTINEVKVSEHNFTLYFFRISNSEITVVFMKK